MSNYKKHTSNQKTQKSLTSLDAIYFKSIFDELSVKLQLSMKELLSEAVIALKLELKLNTDMTKVRMESCKQRVGQIKKHLESRLVAMNAQVNVLYRTVNRSSKCNNTYA